MGKYSFCEELKNKFSIDELKSATLSYRIDGFTTACNMDLSSSICEKMISATRVPYVNKKYEDDKAKYDINFARGYDEKGKYFIILGKYNDLDLLFRNYFDKDRNKEKINELPFDVSIGKVFNNYAYLIKMETYKGSQVKIEITKSKEGESLSNKLTFYSNIKNFSVVLDMIKSFVFNPEIVFMTYNEIMNEKKVDFSNKELSIAMINDKNADEREEKNVKR